MEREDFIFHIAICENDNTIQGRLSSYATALSTELGLTVNIHRYTRMPLNPQTFINRCNYMNLIIIDTKFDEKGTSLCLELLNQNDELPVILVSDEQVELAPASLLIGIIQIPVVHEKFRLLFHRAVGQTLCQRQIKSRCLNLTIGKKKVSLEYGTVISIMKMGEKVEIKCIQGIFLAACSLKEIKEKLPVFFIQINQKTIINTKEIQSFEKKNRTVTMRNKEEHTVTQIYEEMFEQSLKKPE